ncbi:MAG: BrnT family toxin [Desulfuromonadales bacterium]|nr:BrnT family toxin [Desulfuromonadales bacterium]
MIGEIPVMKVVVVVHTTRQGYDDNDSRVRIISARKATKKEREAYFSRRPK